MSDSEGTETSSTPIETPVVTHSFWTRKRRKVEQAGMMRTRGPARAAPSTRPSSSQYRSKTSFGSEMKSASLTSDRTTQSEVRRNRESSFSRKQDRSTQSPAPSTPSQTGGVGTSRGRPRPTPTTSLSSSALLSPRHRAWWCKRSQKEKAATMRGSMDQEEKRSYL